VNIAWLPEKMRVDFTKAFERHKKIKSENLVKAEADKKASIARINAAEKNVKQWKSNG